LVHLLAAVEQQLERARARELRRTAEPAVAEVERRRELLDRGPDELRADSPRLALRTLVRLEPRPHRARVLLRALRALPPHARDLAQHRAERRAAEPVLRWEVRAAVEHVAVRREERGQRPPALPRQRLDGALVARVDVRPFVPVHLHGNEQLVDETRRLLVLVALAVHHVAPVAPHRADVQQDGPLLAPRAL